MMRRLLAVVLASAALINLPVALQAQNHGHQPVPAAPPSPVGGQERPLFDLRKLAASVPFGIDVTATGTSERFTGLPLSQESSPPSRKRVWLGLGIGVAAASAVTVAKCQGSGEQTDCYRMGAVLVLPIGAGVGALAGALIGR